MIGLKIDKAKSMFFDAPKVIRATDKATRRVLSRFGSFVRRTAQLSIKKGPYVTRKKRGQERTDFRRKISKPGKPPHSQTGLLKKFIYFGYDPAKQSVVIGPTRLSKPGSTPELLEYGGSTTITVGRRKRKRRIAATYKARPFMRPAFQQELPKLPAMWRDSVK